MVVRIAVTLIALTFAATTLFAQEQMKQDQETVKTAVTVTQPDDIGTKPATTAAHQESIVTNPVTTAPKQGKKITKFKEVIVTATRTEKGVADAPGDVHVLTKEDIEKRNIKTLDEALNTTPGVFNRRGKGIMDTLANIAIRGVPGANRSLILRDGIPINSAYTGDPAWTGGTGSVERIEVVEGAVSSLYGGYAMGGVVNIITKMPEKSELTLYGGYGTSWNRGQAMDDLWRTYMSYGDRYLDKLSLFASYGYQTTNGFASNYTTQSTCPGSNPGCIPTQTNTGGTSYILGDKGKNGWWDDALNVKAGYDFSKVTRLELSFGRTQSRYAYATPSTYLRDSSGNPTYLPREATYLSGSGGDEINTYTLALESEISNTKTKFNFGLNDVQKNWYTTPSTSASPGYATITGGPGKLSTTPSRNYYTDLQATFPVLSMNLVTIGAAFKHGSADNEEYNLVNWKDETSRTNRTYAAGGEDYTYSLFLQDEINILKNLTAYVGVRGDWWTTQDGYKIGGGVTTDYQSRKDSAFSPKLSLVYKPFELTTIRTSGGMAFRPPTVYELYRTWTSSTGVTYYSNPDLKPETLSSWDISLDQGLWKGAKIKGTYFENYFEDMVYRQTITSTTSIWTNAGRAETKGGVLEAEQKVGGLRLYANYTILTESRIKSNSSNPDSVGKQITYLPEKTYNIGAEYAQGPVSASVVWRHADKLFRNDTNNDTVTGVYTSQDPYDLLDAKIGYEVTKNAKISFAVDNILNKQYFAYYKCPGRSWFADLTIKF